MYKFGTSVNGGVSCWCVYVCFSLQNSFIAIYSALVTNLAFIIFFDYDFLFSICWDGHSALSMSMCVVLLVCYAWLIIVWIVNFNFNTSQPI